MVSEYFTGMFEGVAVMFSMSPEATLYMFVFVIACGLGLSVGLRFYNVWAGVIAFMGTLITFAMLDAFPLWLIAMPVVLIILVSFYMSNSGGGG